MVVVHKLKFQKLGHQIILLFGNFTGRFGDPSKGMKRAHAHSGRAEKMRNIMLKQVSSILDEQVANVGMQNEARLSQFSDVVQFVIPGFTVAQMLERDMFSGAYEKAQPISMHEFFVPAHAGYSDSVVLKADVELGGNGSNF